MQPNKKPNVCVPLSTGIKPTSGASKPVPKSVPRNHRTLPATREKVTRGEEHPRNLNKKNRVDSHLNAKRFVSICNLNTGCSACNEYLFSNKHNKCVDICDQTVNVKHTQPMRNVHQTKKVWKPNKKVWTPISTNVAHAKTQWKPTGRHFNVCDITLIKEPRVEPLDLSLSAKF